MASVRMLIIGIGIFPIWVACAGPRTPPSELPETKQPTANVDESTSLAADASASDARMN
jgi:hypothetical protein